MCVICCSVWFDVIPSLLCFVLSQVLRTLLSVTYSNAEDRGRPKVKISLLAETKSRTESGIWLDLSRMSTESKVVLSTGNETETETESGSYPKVGRTVISYGRTQSSSSTLQKRNSSVCMPSLEALTETDSSFMKAWLLQLLPVVY